MMLIFLVTILLTAIPMLICSVTTSRRVSRPARAKSNSVMTELF